VQIKALEAQTDLALRHDLPVIFHVREAFEDFWPIFDNFKGVRGELHSFTDSAVNLEQGLKRGLFVGVNGISTFTKVEEQRAIFASIPLDRLLLETDAPFLTPAPFRGKVNEPAFVRQIAEFHAKLRGCTIDQIADATTMNTQTLFHLS
jgi:TatD DNase family protein